MLWNEIFSFYVIHVFGGRLLGVQYQGTLGTFKLGSNEFEYSTANTSSVFSFIPDFEMPLGNYLSLIATIITMVAILLFCVFIIKKIIGIVFRLFTGSSAF